MIEYRHSVLPDIYKLAKDLRQADIDEVLATTGESPQKALFRGFISSTECFTLYHEQTGEPVAMFGYRVIEPKVLASIWMLGSERLFEGRWRFLRKSAVWIDYLNTKADLLYNTVDQRNTLHIRWLNWLGFKFVRVIPDFGPSKMPFVEFARLRHGS